MSAEQLNVPAEPFSSSSSESTNSQAKDAGALKGQYLGVPTTRPSRRSSLESSFSELSELSLYSGDIRPGKPFIGSSTVANVSSGTSRGRQAYLRSFWIRNKGMLLVLIAMFFGSGMNVGTRLLETPGPHGEPMHPYQILFTRQSITAACCTIYGTYSGKIPDFPFGPRHVRWLLITRGLTGFFGVFGMYFSLLYLPLAEATVLTFLAPILTCYVCSRLIPGEVFSRQQQLAGLVSMIGVVFIAQPASLFRSNVSPGSADKGFDLPSNSTVSQPEQTASAGPTPHEHLLAIGIAMLGVLGATGAMTSIRAIGTQAHPFVSVNYFSVWCSFVSLICLIVFPDVKFRLPGNLLEWSILAMLGSFGFVMQIMLTVGLAYGGPSGEDKHGDIEESHRAANRLGRENMGSKDVKASGSRATSMLYTQMLFALAGDKLIFGVTPTVMSWIGSGLILAGAMWVAAAKDVNNEDSRKSRRWPKEFLPSGVTEEGDPFIGAEASSKMGGGRLEERQALMSSHADLAEDESRGPEIIEMDDLGIEEEGHPVL